MSGDRIRTIGVGAGAALVVLGVGAYVVSDFASATALIPALFGVVLVALGRFAQVSEDWHRPAYGIALVAALGIAGSARGLPDAVDLVTGEEVNGTVAAASQGLFALVGLVTLLAVAWVLYQDR